MADDMPELQENSRTGILTTGLNRERQQQGGVNHKDVSEGGHGGLRRGGTNGAARGRNNKHKIGSETGNKSQNNGGHQQQSITQPKDQMHQMHQLTIEFNPKTVEIQKKSKKSSIEYVHVSTKRWEVKPSSIQLQLVY